MDALPRRLAPGLSADFEELVASALETLPAELRDYISNVEIVIEDEPPPGKPWLGLYQGLPRTVRADRAWVPPDKITIFRGPIERLSRDDPERLAQEVRHVVLPEVAHHFGISDERLIEIDRY
jgi:predicted Zn-dependent protease with MMP-like domain